MFKKSITYTDFDGQKRTESFYFNLTKAELTEMSLEKREGLDVYIKNIVEAKDQGEMVRIFKKIILMAYGEKSDDGKKFIKKRNGQLLADDFVQSAAYDALFTELASNDKAAAEFFNGIIPKE